MGSGKTTVGKQLSKTLSKKFIDTDHLIEQRTGVDISTIFELEGEDGFRLRETHLLEGLLNQKDLVIASGGGIILSQLNRKLLKKDFHWNAGLPQRKYYNFYHLNLS